MVQYVKKAPPEALVVHQPRCALDRKDYFSITWGNPRLPVDPDFGKQTAVPYEVSRAAHAALHHADLLRDGTC